MAVGLGSMDMPVPSIAKWEWLNWKFPRPVHSGDTIYARWTLTQKRPPVGPVTTAIVVWRVDVHTADGALCAEGEVGASVTRHAIPAAVPAMQEPAQPGTPTSRRRRRRRTTPASAAAKAGADGAAPVVEPVAEAPAKPASPERSSSSARRRRRRRPAGSSAARNGDTPAPAAPIEAPPAPPVVATPAAAAAAEASPLRRVMRRLRRP
jgi:hypothetical protein